jgi:hypothetical protein
MVEDTKLTPEDFNRACSLLPPEKCWGEHLTPEIVLHIADAATNAHLTALESERDALLAAAGKEAVAVAPFGWVKPAGGNYFTRSELSARRIGGMVPVYLAASTAALENGDGRDAWISVDDRMPDEDSVVLVSAWEYGKPDGKRFTLVARRSGSLFLNEETGDDLYTPTHWMPLPAAPAAANDKEKQS